ncbi:hypothetical protein GF345_04690 [Candidatus Woesearchaeota archaeon]|nr:hypothetical protein [Candidatus Woesearchaeota archaeon]
MNIIIDVILVLLLAKILGGIAHKLKLVELLGAIIAGAILGPVFHIVDIENIEPFGKIGLMLVLFLAGFEFKIHDILKEKAGILSTGLLGGLIPFLLGWLLGYLFGMPTEKSLFIGCIFAATSVSISVGTLIDAKKINTKLGRYVLTSSIIDDIIGLFLLIFVVSYVTTKSISVAETGLLMAKIILFALCALLFFYIVPYIFKQLFKLRAEEIEISLSISFILFLAFLSEMLGFSSIIGAFLAGIILGRIGMLREKIEIEKFEAVSMGFFIPFFFAWVGMQLKFDAGLVGWFVVIFIVFAVLGKIIAALISGWIAKMSLKEKTALGIARMARGEVALSVLIIGKELGVVEDILLGSTFMLILVTILLTPLLLEPLLERIKS